MQTFLAFVFLFAVIAGIAGIIKPQLVLLGEKRTRPRAALLYFFIAFVSLIIFSAFENPETPTDTMEKSEATTNTVEKTKTTTDALEKPETPTSSAESSEAKQTESKKKTGQADPNYIPFEYIEIKEKRDIKTTVDALVEPQNGNLPTEKQLKATGRHVSSLHKADNNFVRFYLPGMYGKTGQYATYSHKKEGGETVNIYKANLPQRYLDEKIPAPTKYESLSEMARNFIDYKIKVLEPRSHIQVSREMNESNIRHQDYLVKEAAKKGLVFGVYRVFIHTDIDKIKVTSVPYATRVRDKDYKRYLRHAELTVEITRGEALDLIRKYTDAKSFNDLVGVKYSEDVFMKDSSSPAFQSIIYNDYSPGLNIFASALLQNKS